MDRVFSRASSRILLAVVCLVCSLALIVASSRMWMAAHLEGKQDPSDWKRAAKIEPGNAAYWEQLGLYQEWDFAHGNIQRAIADFQLATRLNPRWDPFWTALASAYEASGQTERARQAYERAQEEHPVSAEVAWQYGSFLLRRGETNQAAEQIHRALDDRPGLAGSAVSQFWKAGVGLDEIFVHVLPARRIDYLAALNYFISQQNDDAALSSWEELVGLNQKVPLHATLHWIDHLIAIQRTDDAARVWKQALVLAGHPNEVGAGGSLIFNGGFEHPLVNGGFGWQWIPASGSVLDLVGDITHSGSQAARVTFDGTANVNFGGLRQYVEVKPGESYRFSAYMRTDSISTDKGPQFVVWNCTGPYRQYAQTAAMTGTHPWTEMQTQFTAGAKTSCIDVVLLRVPSQMFDNKIRGTVWVDDVRLVPAPARGSGSQ